MEHVIDSGHTKVNFCMYVKNPLKWTAETPHLYYVSIVISVDDKVLQTIRHHVGFRRVELRNGLVSVNGRPIFFRGVNRHDHHPHRGRAVPLSFVRQDLLLMKTHNINSIRCSHYPSQPGLYKLADELGFWIIDEADLECHGFEAVVPSVQDPDEQSIETLPNREQFTSDNPDWCGAYLDRMIQLVQRDKNHPSVIIWSLGNESFFGRNHRQMSRYARVTDPSRLLHYQPDGSTEISDIFSYMYTAPDQLVDLATRDGDNFEKPVLLCEYAHAMGNGPGGLQEYQDTIRKYRRLQGGMIWEWANHGLWVDGKGGKKGYYAYGGDFGDEPNDNNIVIDGLCFSNHTPTPGLTELKKAFAPVQMCVEGESLVIANEYDFVDLKHLVLTYKVETFNGRYCLSSRLYLGHVLTVVSVQHWYHREDSTSQASPRGRRIRSPSPEASSETTRWKRGSRSASVANTSSHGRMPDSKCPGINTVYSKEN